MDSNFKDFSVTGSFRNWGTLKNIRALDLLIFIKHLNKISNFLWASGDLCCPLSCYPQNFKRARYKMNRIWLKLWYVVIFHILIKSCLKKWRPKKFIPHHTMDGWINESLHLNKWLAWKGFNRNEWLNFISRMYEWMNVWIDELMNEWMNRCINEWVSKWIDEWMNE